MISLKQGHRYRATLTLGLLEQLADNEMIAAAFRKYGFIDVHVKGFAGQREAEGIWAQPSTRLDPPSQVTNLCELPQHHALDPLAGRRA